MSIQRFLLAGIALITTIAAQAQQPALTEYFLDSDPGYGKAHSASSNQVGENQMTFDLSDAEPGVHVLSIRMQDSEGKWSTTMSRPLFIDRIQWDKEGWPYMAGGKPQASPCPSKEGENGKNTKE